MKSLIAAVDKRGGMGAGGRPLWRDGLVSDTQRFRALTAGSTVVMGRKAFESFHGVLPGRQNIVVSRHFRVIEGVTVVRSLKEAYQEAINTDINIIGGGDIFSQAIYDADRIYLTEVDYVFDEADTFFPVVDPHTWHEIKREEHPSDGFNLFNYSFVTYTRAKKR